MIKVVFYPISVLAMHQLTEHADCVLPVENQVQHSWKMKLLSTFHYILCIFAFPKAA